MNCSASPRDYKATPYHPAYPVETASKTRLFGLELESAAVGFDAAVQKAYHDDPASVRKQDKAGFTPLHVAAAFRNVSALRALLALPTEAGVRGDLKRRDNVVGQTPLEVCEIVMRTTRERCMTMGDPWTGYSERDLLCVLLLKRAMGQRIQGSQRDFIEQRKWGCTCGKCVWGFVSPRMRCRLLCESRF